jgi:hypothetical protein
MNNFDAMRQQTFDHQQELLAEAARRRLVSSARRGRVSNQAPARPVRVGIAAWLRRTADRLEPVADQRPQVAMLRAVAHREISVDQALRWLDDGNGHRSAIV